LKRTFLLIAPTDWENCAGKTAAYRLIFIASTRNLAVGDFGLVANNTSGASDLRKLICGMH